jgi:hypothetical protein
MRKCRILLFIFMVFLTACVPALPQDSMPTVDIPMQTINTVLQIKTPTRQTEFKADKSINLTVENISEIFVALSVNCNIKVFTYLDTSWVEIGNKMQYFWLVEDSDGVSVLSSEGSRTLSPIMESKENWAESRMSCDFLPVVEQDELPFMVRVFVSGNIVSDGIVTDEETGAYIDLLLK